MDESDQIHAPNPPYILSKRLDVIKQNHEGDLRKQTSGPKIKSVTAGTILLRNDIEQLNNHKPHTQVRTSLLTDMTASNRPQISTSQIRSSAKKL